MQYEIKIYKIFWIIFHFIYLHKISFISHILDNMVFSKNIWIKSDPILQQDWMEDKLKNRIRNTIINILSNRFPNYYYHDTRDKLICNIWDYFWCRFDEIPNNLSGFKKFLNNNFFINWFDVYDFIEFFHEFIWLDEDFKNKINLILKEENSAYQLTSSWDIIPIVEPVEILSIEETLWLPYENVKKHIRTAIQLFKKNPQDYRNSIKESISAVEAICWEIIWNPKASLWDALKKLKDAWVNIHPALESWFGKIYWYTSDDWWIRHSLSSDSNEPDFDDAKYMLVSCSAFINYLISKHISLD